MSSGAGSATAVMRSPRFGFSHGTRLAM